MPSRRRPLAPAQVLVVGFLGLIAIGTLLLALPAAAAEGRHISLVDALFTATSAVCVTGLVVLDTPNDLSLFGQIVVLLLIQAGGLGYMTLATIVAALLGRQTTFQERLTLQEALNLQSLEGLLRFARTVFLVSLAFEAAGALALTVRWMGEAGLVRAAYLGVFHSVSAFNNAGFSLFSDSLLRYRGDLAVNLIVSTLVICGGIGFLVLSEIGRSRWRVPWSLHTRFVLALTAILIATATVAIFVLERRNPETLGLLGTGDALVASYFQAVTPRTAGFNTLNVGAFETPTLFLVLLLMFVGAAPGSTGGGIKITTFGVVVLALVATVRGRTEAAVFGRRIPGDLIARAFFIGLISFLFLNLVAGLLLVVEDRALMPVLFETTSAFGTVGLSMGDPVRPVSLSGGFSTAGRLLITAMMFAGRVGPLTLAVAVAHARERRAFRYPEGKVLVG